MDKFLHENIKIIDVNTLVISGGAMMGFLFLGTIKLLNEYNILKKIKYYYGTSFGGILVTGLNLGWNLEDFTKFSNFPLDIMIDFNIDNFINNYGLIPKINYETLFKKIIKYKGFNEDITFLDLYNKTKKELNLVTYNMTKNIIEVLNYKDTPNLKVWEGLYMTSALPIIFPPYEYNGDIYVDGGICENFGINYINKSNINKTIGIKLNVNIVDSSNLNYIINDKNLLNYFNYSLELVKSIFTRNKTYNTSNYFNLSLTDNLTLYDKVNLSLNNDIKLNMINDGYKQSVSQINNIINTMFKLQLDEHKINKINKYYEL
jgi:NTE family protein